jgi:glycosyltransferase involved in cell wall biosynthesis
MLDKRKARSKLNIDNEKIVFCFVATSITRFNKGLNELMEAINLVPKENIEFISVGDGNFKSLHYSIRYRHLGKLKSDELKIVYSASDALIFPTKEEALGNVVLEAMACGTPVIGTPVGGLTDVIRDGFNGIFTKGVTVTDIKNAILHFIEIRKEFDRNAIRSYIEKKFSEEKIAKEYLDVYSKLLSRTSEGVVT